MDEFDSILSKYNQPEIAPEKELSDPFDSILNKYEVPQESGFNRPRFAAEQAARGFLDVPNLLREEGQKLSGIPSMGQTEQSIRETGKLPRISEYKFNNKDFRELVPETVQDTEGEHKILGQAARGLGSALFPIPGAGMGKTVSGIAKNIGKAGVMGAGIGGTSATLQEAGIPSPIADIAGISAGIAAPGLLSRSTSALKNPKLSHDEKIVSKILQEEIGEKHIPGVLERIRGNAPYKTGYTPTTAEIARNPDFANLERIQETVSGSGIAGHKAEQGDILRRAWGKHESEFPLTGEKAQNVINKRIKKLKESREEKTAPLYEKVKHNKEVQKTSSIKSYIKEEKDAVAGDLANDLRYVEKLIKPKNVVKKSEVNALKKQGLSDKKIKEVYEKEHPERLYPPVSQLSAAHRAINAKLKKFKKSGEEDRMHLMMGAKKALEKDLENVPEHVKATKLYRQLSEPIEKVRKYPAIKSLLKESEKGVGKSTESLERHIFNKNIKENMSAFNNAFKNNPKAREELKNLYTNKMIRSMHTTAPEGEGLAFTYPGFSKFLKNYGSGMEEVLTKPQMELVTETERILLGRNRASRLGEGKNSATQGRLSSLSKLESRLEAGREDTLVGKLGKHTKIIGKSSPFVKNYFERLSKEKVEKLKDILNKSLVDPKIADNFLSYKFPSQKNFDQYANLIYRTPLPAIEENYRKRKEESEGE